MKRHLFIDAQVFQTPAWDRGMGKYSLELLVALNNINSQNKVWDSITLLGSSRIKTERRVFESINEVLPDVPLILIDLEPNEPNNKRVADRNREVINNELQHRVAKEDKVYFLILSLLQSEIAPAFPSLPNSVNTLLFYDVIPLMFHETYLIDQLTKKRYLTKLAELFRADYFLAISKTVANDLAVYTGIDPSRIHNIDGGAVRHGNSKDTYIVPKPFILMPTGNDIRKNNRRAIEGFELFNKRNKHRYELVITSSFHEHEVRELQKLSNNVRFTGNIDGKHLNYLYEHAEGLLFPSEYEGLGMPIIEALEKDKPVACSDIAVFREISHTAFYYFDPKSQDSIALALQDMLITKSKRVAKREINRILNRYTWTQTAEKLVKAVLGNSRQQSEDSGDDLIIFADSPESNSTSSFVQRLHAEFSRRYRTNYYLSDFASAGRLPRTNYLQFVANTGGIKDFGGSSDFASKRILHVLSAKSHPAGLVAALGVPDVLILLDFELRELWDRALREGYISKTRYEAERRLNGAQGDLFLGSLVACSRRVVVPDDSDATAVSKVAKALGINNEIHVLPLPGVQLVYPDILPLRRNKVALSLLEYEKDGLAICDMVEFLTASPNSPTLTHVVTDYEKFSVLQHTAYMILDLRLPTSALRELISVACGFGVICVGLDPDDSGKDMGLVKHRCSSMEEVRDYIKSSRNIEKGHLPDSQVSFSDYVEGIARIIEQDRYSG